MVIVITGMVQRGISNQILIVISAWDNDYVQETQVKTLVESRLSVKVRIKQTKKAYSDIRIGVVPITK